MNILVTGGAGYIGSHACKALAKSGLTPISYDNLINGHRWAVKWGPLEVGDISDRERLSEVFKKYKPIAVMHFASYAYVGESVKEPSKYYRNNVVGSLTLLEVMRDFKIDKIIFSSTCATYGIPKIVPISEEHQQNPINPYGASKLMIERILKDFDISYDLRSISLRYFNAFGADPEGELGEVHNPETHLIPLALDVALGNRSAITIFGDDYDTSDGTCIRDYVHVSDIAAAHVLALNALLDGSNTNAYNLGNEFGVSVKQVIKTVEAVTGKNVPVIINPRRVGDPAVLIGDASKIINDLGWSPSYKSIYDSIMHAFIWKKHYNELNFYEY